MLGSDLASVTHTYVLARYGWQQEIGKFSLTTSLLTDAQASHQACQRGARLVVETARGLEVAECLQVCGATPVTSGLVLRCMRPEDEYLHAQLQHLSQLAHDRCVDWLKQQQHDSVLLFVEPLLDGQTLLFHFLAQVDDAVQVQVDQLVALYEAEVAASPFAQRLVKGCGPNCGTAEATGKGCAASGACSSCSVGCGATLTGRRQSRKEVATGEKSGL
ncbi:MAG TPA: hypothetical protein DCF63_18460 [Planctomycetaceae bacterium]|nr:hypothetical protein [Planctomycetaceae bacterium]